MVLCKRSRVFVISVLAILLVILMMIAQTIYYNCTPDRLSPLEQSYSHSAMTDSQKTPKRKKSKKEQHTAGMTAEHQLTQRDIDGVRYFVLFIGYAHSGHSIIGSMMDAHPNMVIAHEYNLIGKWSKNREHFSNKNTLFNELCDTSRSNIASNGWYNNQEKGYTLAIPDLWQGCRFTHLKVIGDKRGGIFTNVATSNFEKTMQVFDEVKETVGVPIKLVHVVRNPFDMIATTCIGATTVGQHRWDDENFKENDSITTNVISRMKRRAERIMAVEKEWGADMLEIHHADFVHDPKAVLQKICDFFDVDCPKEYLETCYNKTFTTVSKSRYLINWPSDVVAEGEAMMKKIPFFSRYSFDSE